MDRKYHIAFGNGEGASLQIENIKRLVRIGLRRLGLDLHRFNPATSDAAQIAAAIEHIHANIVFDIGANTGQFAADLRLAGFSGRIISFEPLSSAHRQLYNAARSDTLWQVHPRTALGDQDGKIAINIAKNSVSSSVLPMLGTHSSACTNSVYIGTEDTPLARLDTVGWQYVDQGSRPFIKIDSQGFEWQILDGATDILKIAHGVLLEVSMIPLYAGQRLWQDLLKRMESDGFSLWALQKGFTDPKTGRSLQLNAIFLREPCQSSV